MNSSISSSDPGAEKTVSDARPSVVSVLMFSASLVMGVVAAESCRLALMPVDQQRISRYGKSSIRYIVIGDSTEQMAIDSTVLGPECVNLSVSGSGFGTWEPILLSAIRDLPQLETVIMSADPMSLVRDGFGPRNNDYSDLYACGAMPADIPGISPDQQTSDYIQYKSPLRVLCAGPRLDWRGLCSYLRSIQVMPGQTVPVDSSQGAEKKKMYFQMFRAETCAPDNLAALRRLLGLIKEHQLNLVLVRTPVTPPFYETEQETWESWHDRILAVVDEVLEEEQVATVFLQQPDDFSMDNFWDPNHLNGIGKSRFSKILSTQLEQLNVN